MHAALSTCSFSLFRGIDVERDLGVDRGAPLDGETLGIDGDGALGVDRGEPLDGHGAAKAGPADFSVKVTNSPFKFMTGGGLGIKGEGARGIDVEGTLDGGRGAPLDGEGARGIVGGAANAARNRAASRTSSRERAKFAWQDVKPSGRTSCPSRTSNSA